MSGAEAFLKAALIGVGGTFILDLSGMGAGVLASRMPWPNAARFKSIVRSSVFGPGLYVTARLLATKVPVQMRPALRNDFR